MGVPDAGFPVEVIKSVPVVSAPEDIDITNAAGLRAALLQAAACGHGTFVIDMSHTQFCDTGFTPWWPRTSGPAPKAARCCWSSAAPPSAASSRSPDSTA
jgi:hypothetical protein